MEVKIKRPGLDDGGFWEYAEGTSAFFATLRSPQIVSQDEINKALDWLLGLVVVPEGEKEKAYRDKVKKIIRGYSFNELINLITMPEAEPDPKS